MPMRDMNRTVPTLRLTAALSLLAGTPVALAQNVPGLGDNPANQTGQNNGFTGGFGNQDSFDASGDPNSDVNVGEYEQIELHFRDEDISTALQLLAMQAERSIVTTNNVSGTVTANLYGVSFLDALDSILLYNGFGYIEQGGTIFVMPREDILAWEQSQRVAESAVIRLSYLNAVDAAQFAQGALSADGTITTNGVTGEFSLSDTTPSGGDSYHLGAVMVVHDYPENIEEVRAIVSELDTRPVSVLVEATILQKSISDAYGYGVDFTVLADLDFLEFVNGPLSAAQTLITGGSESTVGGSVPADPGGVGASTIVPMDGGGTAVTSSVGNTAGRGGFKVGVVSNDVAVFVRLLDEMGDTTIISNPKLLTLNRQAASVQVGRRVGYLSTTTTDTSTQQTVEFLDTGTQLYVRPFVGHEGNIRMEIQPEVSQPIIREVGSDGGGTVTIPDEDTSRLSTNVEVQDGQTVVLGGLFTERTSTARRQIPVIGDIPFLGMAFRGEDNSVDRAEIIFMITPTIVEDESMADAGIRALEQVDFARAGAREGLLYWSRERRASQLLVDAQKFAAKGDTRTALDKVGRALALQPGMTDAVLLRESLVLEPTIWPSRSGLEDVINSETMARVDMFRDAILAKTESISEPTSWTEDESFSSVDDDFQSWNEQSSNSNDGESFVSETWDNDNFQDRDGMDFPDDDFEYNDFRNQDFDNNNSDGMDFPDDDFEYNEFQNESFDNNRFDSSDDDSFWNQSSSNNSFNSEKFDNDIANSGRGQLDGFEQNAIDDWDKNFGGHEGFDSGFDADDEDMTFGGNEGFISKINPSEISSDVDLDDASGARMSASTVDQQFQVRSQFLSLTNNEVQRAIEAFAQDFSRFPTIAEMQSAPVSGETSDFGILIDGGYLAEAPINPFFARSMASDVGSVGSDSAFVYDAFTGTAMPGDHDFASVWESGDVVDVDSSRMVSMVERNVQDVIKTYRQLTGSYPSLAELQTAPWDEAYGPSFGALIDEGLLASAPANPFFRGHQAFSIGAPGSDAAWHYNERTNEVTANRSQFANVVENSGQDD